MSVLSDLVRIAVLFDESDLEILDKRISAAIWGDDGHTISYHLGKLEEQVPPDEVAVKVCNILAELLGPNHCKNAVINEGG